ncbi:MAG: hypothetical protein ACYC27_14650 [Armatimonadota bacterium]
MIGPNLPTVAEQTDRGGAYAAWTDVLNILLDDNNRAASAANVTTGTDYLVARDFGFALTEADRIAMIQIDIACNGVEVLEGGSLEAQEVCDEVVSLLIDGVVSAVNLARPAEPWALTPGTESTRTFYTTEQLTYTQFNSAQFGVVLSGKAMEIGDPAPTCNVDSIKITLHLALENVWQPIPLGLHVHAIKGPMGM